MCSLPACNTIRYSLHNKAPLFEQPFAMSRLSLKNHRFHFMVAFLYLILHKKNQKSSILKEDFPVTAFYLLPAKRGSIFHYPQACKASPTSHDVQCYMRKHPKIQLLLIL